MAGSMGRFPQRDLALHLTCHFGSPDQEVMRDLLSVYIDSVQTGDEDMLQVCKRRTEQ